MDYQEWYWWTPFDVQDIIGETAELKYAPSIMAEKLRAMFIGAPLLHIGYKVRPGIDTPEPIKCPRYQLGIITDISFPPDNIPTQGYTIRVNWETDVIPSQRRSGRPRPDWLPDGSTWDPNPTPPEWKKENPLWIIGKGAYGPNTLVFTPGHDGGLADAFMVLMAKRPIVDKGGLTRQRFKEGSRAEHVLGGMFENIINPSHSRTFTKEKYQETGEPITNPEDLREKFREWDQAEAFDEGIDRIIPNFQRSVRLAINWESFDQLTNRFPVRGV
jgi:hypothetical protein